MAINRDTLTGVPEPIKSLLSEKRFSINSLADATGIPYTTLRRRLREPNGLTMGDLLRIAAALEVSPAALIPAALVAATAKAA